jgi:AraC family transcriptional regulator of adaptative response / DNA-3-methyladenine glycosylase II
VLDSFVCYRALQTRDERFDGRLFVGVISTGIYCRPVCPAGPPKAENCRFFPTAAAAHEAGFRPCLRCRPETAPDLGSWRGTSNTVSRALALIAEGGLDGEEAGVEALAERLGVGGRQLRRLFKQHLGASPLAVAQTRRVLLAKQLIHDTALPMADIALASGFGSVRRFNETFQHLFQRAPSALRRAPAALRTTPTKGVTVLLRYRPPYDWDAMLSHLRARAIDGVEHVDGKIYRRTMLHEGESGTLEVVHVPARQGLAVTIRCASVRSLYALVARIRRVFDLGTDVQCIGAHLARDPLLAPLVTERPGLRLPGGWDGFEFGVRAILGQQVSVEAGRRLASTLVHTCGGALATRMMDDSALTRTFPTAEQVAVADLSGLGLPIGRRRALGALARASLGDPTLFQPLDSVERMVAKLSTVAGIGAWTAELIALRAAHEPDAFPASDVGLLRSAARRQGKSLSPAQLHARAQRWRPWRSYAAQHLWTADSATQRAAKEKP